MTLADSTSPPLARPMPTGSSVRWRLRRALRRRRRCSLRLGIVSLLLSLFVSFFYVCFDVLCLELGPRGSHRAGCGTGNAQTVLLRSLSRHLSPIAHRSLLIASHPSSLAPRPSSCFCSPPRRPTPPVARWHTTGPQQQWWRAVGVHRTGRCVPDDSWIIITSHSKALCSTQCLQ